MKFSVLMSVYRGDDAAQLLRAIRSVTLEQTLRPAQLVLVKDGPVPLAIDEAILEARELLGTLRIAFSVLSKEQNGGLAAALNTGLSACSCAYVARMDADDVALPERFALELAYLEQHPEISVLGGGITEFESDEARPLQERTVPQEHEEIVRRLRTRNAMNHVTVVFKKSDIVSLGGYSEDFGRLEDYKLWIDAAHAGLRLHNLAQVCVNVRVGAGFIERRSDRREIRDWDMLQDYLVRIGMIGRGRALCNRFSIRAFIYMPAWMKKIAYQTILRRKRNV